MMHPLSCICFGNINITLLISRNMTVILYLEAFSHILLRSYNFFVLCKCRYISFIFFWPKYRTSHLSLLNFIMFFQLKMFQSVKIFWDPNSALRHILYPFQLCHLQVGKISLYSFTQFTNSKVSECDKTMDTALRLSIEICLQMDVYP